MTDAETIERLRWVVHSKFGDDVVEDVASELCDMHGLHQPRDVISCSDGSFDYAWKRYVDEAKVVLGISIAKGK